MTVLTSSWLLEANHRSADFVKLVEFQVGVQLLAIVLMKSLAHNSGPNARTCYCKFPYRSGKIFWPQSGESPCYCTKRSMLRYETHVIVYGTSEALPYDMDYLREFCKRSRYQWNPQIILSTDKVADIAEETLKQHVSSQNYRSFDATRSR
jgi:hypothetical protein